MSASWSLVVVCDAHYTLPTAVCLHSISTHVTTPPASVHVLAEEISREDEALISKQVSGAPVTFTSLRSPLTSFVAHEEAAHVSAAMFLKCVAPRVLQDAADTLVYLDSDTLVRGDLAELAATSMGEFVAGLVRDRYVTENFIDPGPHPYFNSGVMLINVPRWNDQMITEAILAEIIERAQELRYPDQDALNKALRGSILPLDKRWNYMVGETAKNDPTKLVDTEVEESTILHYCGPTKPWRTHLPHPWLHATYARYLTLVNS